jgi:hypothetical protein
MAAHRYWRINCSGSIAGDHISLGELEFRESVGGAQAATGGTALSGGDYSSSYLPAEAFNGVYSTFNSDGWVALLAQSGWVGYDWGSGNSADIIEVAIWPRGGNHDEAPLNFNVEYSDNGTDWSVLWAVADATYSADTLQVFSVEITTSGELASTEAGSDSASFAGLTVHRTGTMAATESGSDTAYLTDESITFGAMAVAETGADTAALSGCPIIGVAIAASETGSDTTTAFAIATTATNANFVFSLPPIAVAIEAKGVNCDLIVSLPEIEFLGETSSPAWLDFTLPVPQVLLGSGSSLALEIPFQDFVLTAVSGATCSLDLDLPPLVFDAQTGAALAFDLAVIEAALSGTTGLAADLHLNFPALEVLLEGTVGQLAQLQISLPPIGVSFTASQQTLGVLLLEIPPLQVLLSGSVGTVASLLATLPVPEILMSSYEDISGSLVVTLPVPKFYLEGAAMARFDDYILSYTRPS